jgi:hypothetical protein
VQRAHARGVEELDRVAVHVTLVEVLEDAVDA